jgi:DNA-binding response OmpR family regulator
LKYLISAIFLGSIVLICYQKCDDNKLTKQDKQEIRKKKRILIVDDERDITNSFSLALEDSGLFDVDTFNDPRIALSNFKPNHYDLLLFDIKMPHMNGFELYDEIKKMDNNVKVCFISAYDVDYNALREQFPSLEMDCFIPQDFITKPTEISKLIERLELELLT